MALSKKQLEILTKIAKEHDLSIKEVEDIYCSPFKFIRSITNELPVKDIDDEEELRKLKTNFTLPSLGKLHLNIFKVLRFKEKQRERNE